MNEGHDDATPTGGNNSVEQFQPEPQAPKFDAQLQPGSQSSPSQPEQQLEQPAQSSPQGIFSSGDLAVNSENLEEIKPQLSEENKSRIASAFAQTDATQKRDQLSDQMADQDAISGTVLPAGAGFGSNTTASSATGDIRIPGAKKKSKAPLLILAALAVIAVVVGGVWWVMRGRENVSNQPATALSATEEAFAKYANYLLYGEEKATFDGEYKDNENYVLNQQLESPTYDQEYWDKSEVLLKTTLATLYQPEESADKELLINTMEDYQATFDFLKIYKRTGDIGDEALLAAYIENGTNGTEALLDSFYSAFYSLNDGTAAAYANQRKQQYRNVVEIYSIYRELGCIVDGVFDESACRSATPSLDIQERLTQTSLAVSQDMRLANTIVENASQYLISYCWDLYNWIRNPNQLKEGFNG